MKLPRTTSDMSPQALGAGLALGVVGDTCAKGRWDTRERGIDLDLRRKKALLQTINLIRTQLVKCTLKIHLWKRELLERARLGK